MRLVFQHTFVCEYAELEAVACALSMKVQTTEILRYCRKQTLSMISNHADEHLFTKS